jgi:hypothetical protein
MTTVPRDPKGLLDAMAGVVRTELDRVYMPADPPLILSDSERWVLLAVLSRRVSRDELPQIDGRHFAIGAWGVLWDASRETLDTVALHMAVTGAGYPSVSTDIAEMCDYDGPLPSLIDLASMATRIRDYWARRRVYSQTSAANRLLAAEAITMDGYWDLIRAVAKEIKV